VAETESVQLAVGRRTYKRQSLTRTSAFEKGKLLVSCVKPSRIRKLRTSYISRKALSRST
jgi:hypothetical protein